MHNKFGLDKTSFTRLINEALRRGGEFADVFFQYSINSEVIIQEDIVKNTSNSISLGIGIRVIDGERTGYAFTNDLSWEKMVETAHTASIIANSQSKINIRGINRQQVPFNLYDYKTHLIDNSTKTQINLLRRAYDAAKNFDTKIEKVTATLNSSLTYITIANSEGLMISDTRPQVRLIISSTANDGKTKSTAMANNGGRYNIDFFINNVTPEQIGKQASEEAIILLDARNAPMGEIPVVLDSFESGVMIHEAIGHPLELDSIRNKTSVMWDKFGQMVANPIVTIYDNPNIAGFRGSYNIDDEGMVSTETLLVEKGRLVGFMNDFLNAKLMNHQRNAHGRRQSYRYPPIPRMSNTILAPGEHNPQEIIESVKFGILAKTFQGGMVNSTGKFTFSINLGYLIENGKITAPIKNATLIGSNLEILKRIEMVGNDTQFFLGTCGKNGQSVPVTCGTPTLKISKMTVGGTNE